MLRFLISPFVEAGELKHISTSRNEWLNLIRHHIGENYGPSLTRTERQALGSMKYSPEVELPVSLWARVWDRPSLVARISTCRFLDVRTKVQILTFLRKKSSTRFSDLFHWYIRDLYHTTKISTVDRAEGRDVSAAVKKYLDESGVDITMEDFTFKRTTTGFNVYRGPRILAYSDDFNIYYLDDQPNILKMLVSNKFAFECCLGLYNHLISVY